MAEDNAIRAEKEREVQKLRDMQQRAQDRQADIDSLRAKRAFEEGERLAREKERKEIIYKQRVLQEMEEARQKQFADKEMQLAQQAKQQRDEFTRVINKQKQDEENDRMITMQKMETLKNHGIGIR